jgi:hypothetical protein
MAAVEVLKYGDRRLENDYGLQTTGLDESNWTEEDSRIRLRFLAKAWIELRELKAQSTTLVRRNETFQNFKCSYISLCFDMAAAAVVQCSSGRSLPQYSGVDLEHLKSLTNI